ncbi:hypothetical protein D9757_001137 [Collybiopsis confluens]|uniref:Uncharacterized protein n=1 Tax=Collybiopsis confluens TaxID=2823264 RepID=A0A8H5I0L8_9AGAR|nr:hypothetical protein D9757_001137 [Collybiopsis confluens]
MNVNQGGSSKRLSLTEQSILSVVSNHATALEICESVYGEQSTSYDGVERYYEASASYENPLITTTSSAMLADVLRLSRQLSVINVPRPLAVIYSLFRLKVPEYMNSPWIHALRAWTEVDDINESESFDGHRKTIVEHTLNVLVFPDVHTDTGAPVRFNRSTESFSSPPPTPASQILPSRAMHPSLPIPGTSLTVPSPFHLKLRIITRFSFNEQGRITHHRDFWDVKDVMGLVPGVSLAQWIGTRIAARGLSYASRVWLKGSSSNSQISETDAKIRELEDGHRPSPAAEYARSAQKGFVESAAKGPGAEPT